MTDSLKDIIALLEDSNAQVRDAAQSCLGQLYICMKKETLSALDSSSMRESLKEEVRTQLEKIQSDYKMKKLTIVAKPEHKQEKSKIGKQSNSAPISLSTAPAGIHVFFLL